MKILILLIIVQVISCSSDGSGSTFTDSRDGKKYKVVKIGSQTWMAENMSLRVQGVCDSNCGKYGRLYDWESAMDICPKGWHLPSDAEWDTLVAFAGGEYIAGGKLKSKKGWDMQGNPKESNGTDSYGFSALPGGYDFGVYSQGKRDSSNNGYWWSSTEYGSFTSWRRSMNIGSSIRKGGEGKHVSHSVRCVKDAEGANYKPAEVDHSFSIYGKWVHVMQPNTPSEWRTSPPSITVNRDNTVLSVFYESHYAGVLNIKGIYKFTFNANSNKTEEALTYNPATNLLSHGELLFRKTAYLDGSDFIDEERNCYTVAIKTGKLSIRSCVSLDCEVVGALDDGTYVCPGRMLGPWAELKGMGYVSYSYLMIKLPEGDSL
jgi:uncharacterized protein (TIGR02145 family)